MSTHKFSCLISLGAICLLPSVCSAQGPNLGRPLTPEEIRKIDITVSPDGRGLPREADRFRRARPFMRNPARSATGRRARGSRRISSLEDLGTLAIPKPVKTPASYWPAATTLFDYIRRAMPITSPQSLTNDEVYAVTAYILSIDGIVPADAVLDAKSLPRVKMPNKDGFVSWWPKPPR